MGTISYQAKSGTWSGDIILNYTTQYDREKNQTKIIFSNCRVEYSSCTCQEKVDTKQAKLQKAQFGFVLNWAFVAQGSSGAKIIIEINIAIQQIRKILSILKSEVEI